MPSRRRQLARWIARFAAAVVLAGVLYVAWDQATYNFGELQPGRIYRSGQMPASALGRTIRDHKIKTVLNLRGSNKDAWYSSERKATLDAGATQIDIAMSSCIWMSRAQLRTVIETLDTAEYPDADPLPVGLRTNRPRLGVRGAAPGRTARSTTPAPSSRSATCSSGGAMARSWPSTWTSTNDGSPSRDGRMTRRISGDGSPTGTARRPLTASNGLTIRIPWW